MADEPVDQAGELAPDTSIEMPAPTAWPIALAFGITLLFAGLVTSEAVSVLGAIISVAGAIGWFRDVLPLEKHEPVRVLAEPPPVATSRPAVVGRGWLTALAGGVHHAPFG